jgi:hypothetical protein
MTHAATLAASSRKEAFAKWRKGEVEFRFGVSRSAIGASSTGKQIESKFARRGVIFRDFKDGGWLAILYRRLCERSLSGGVQQRRLLGKQRAWVPTACL